MVAGTSKYKHQDTNEKGAPAKNITKSQYRRVLTETLLPGGQRVFGVPGLTRWLLQQDGDPTHVVAKEVVTQWNKSNTSTVEVLGNWPPNSPDLNPIENVWAYVQARVDKLGCASFEDFTAAVIGELTHLRRPMLVRLVNSMSQRMAAVVANEGGKTKY